MIPPLKKSIGIAILFLLPVCLASFCLPQPYCGMVFGKAYNPEKDFTCCMNNHLIIHHYYHYNVLFVNVNDGYDTESLIKPSSGYCNIQCAN